MVVSWGYKLWMAFSLGVLSCISNMRKFTGYVRYRDITN